MDVELGIRTLGRLFSVFPNSINKICRSRIVGKDRNWVMPFIYKYKTSITYPLYETMKHFALINKWHLWVQSALPTICLYPQSAFTHNPPLPTIRLYPQSGYNHKIYKKLMWNNIDLICNVGIQTHDLLNIFL